MDEDVRRSRHLISRRRPLSLGGTGETQGPYWFDVDLAAINLGVNASTA